MLYKQLIAKSLLILLGFSLSLTIQGNEESTYIQYKWKLLGACGPDGNGQNILLQTLPVCCTTGKTLPASDACTGSPSCTSVCSSNLPANFPREGQIYANNCEDSSTVPQCTILPDLACDISKQPDNWPHDSNCGQNEYECASLAQDEYPARFATGAVKTNPIDLLDLPSVPQLPFNLAIRFDSQLATHPTTVNNGVPVSSYAPLSSNFIGMGWVIDRYSDFLARRGPDEPMVWYSSAEMISFPKINGNSKGNKYRLTDNGVGVSPRYSIMTNGATEPRKIWRFSEFSRPDGKLNNILITSISIGDGVATDSYRIDINRAPDGHITNITDTLGRRLIFYYSNNGAYRIDRITLSIAKSPETVIGTFFYTYLNQLAWVEYANTYRRFRYLDMGDKRSGKQILTEVISPAEAGAFPTIYAPKQPNEIILEGHEFRYVDGVSHYGYPSAARTYGPGRNYFYKYETDKTTQLDLHLPDKTCQSNTCQKGYGCWNTDIGGDNMCYVANEFVYDRATRNPKNMGSSGGNSAGGARASVAMKYSGNNAPISVSEGTTNTTYAYNSNGDVVCKVNNDDDDQAAVDSNRPELGCDPPATGQHQVVSVSYGTNTMTKTTKSVLAENGNTTITETYDQRRLLLSRRETGYTRNIDGTQRQETRINSYQYDSNGRIIKVDGPRPNTQALDVTTYEYWTTAPADSVFNIGQLRNVKQYVGNSTASYPLITQYDKYDAYGVPHQITHPWGGKTTFTTPDRLTWTISTTGGATSTLQLNPNGTVRSYIDPDNVCITYDYRSGSELLLHPTVIKRSPATSLACGATPIDVNTGEVETREYEFNEPERLKRVIRRMNGVVAYEKTGFIYDDQRRLVGMDSLDSDKPFVFNYQGDLMTAMESLGWGQPGSWKSEIETDDLARPIGLFRALSPTSNQTYQYSYDKDFNALPTRVTRGLDGAQSTTTTYLYSDFGELLETNSPDHGTVRFEYDAASNPVKIRHGMGTTAMQTDLKIYDSIGRLLSVDNDVEHPVACGGTNNGTQIGDEEYIYDQCTGPSPAGFSCNYTMGQLRASIAVQQCTNNTTLKRGRWYTYDIEGRPKTVAFASIQGSIVSPAKLLDYQWSKGSLLQSISSPLNPAYGTKYNFPPGTDRPNGLGTLGSTAIPTKALIKGPTYAPFGPSKGYAGILSAVNAGGNPLYATFRYRPDYTLSGIRWAHSPDGTPSPITYLDQTLTYAPEGTLIERQDKAVIPNSRFYQYDPLLRLTCEVRGVGTTYPNSSGCIPSSRSLAGLFTYHDGALPNEPPDNRAKTVVQAGSYSPGSETYSYVAGTNKLSQVTRTNTTGSITSGNTVFEYDPRGRRIAEYDTVDLVKSRRNYAYLPNGRLGSITGYIPGGVKYTAKLTYDTHNRPDSIFYLNDNDALGGVLTELYYDDASRLIAANISSPKGTKTVRWHYHYLDDQAVAATREIITGAPVVISTNHFWLIYDERGLIHRMLDETGVEHYRARYDASGWRTVEAQAADIWMPFVHKGQLEIAGTESLSKCAICGGKGNIKPALIVNQARVYDPLLGSFLSPDEADLFARKTPEGYSYALNNPNAFYDVDGNNSIKRNSSIGIWLWKDCRIFGPKIIPAIFQAYDTINNCTKFFCRYESNRKRWTEQLLNKIYDCKDLKDDHAYSDGIAITINNYNLKNYGIDCLATTLAHEALHETLRNRTLDELEFFNSIVTSKYPSKILKLMSKLKINKTIDNYFKYRNKFLREKDSEHVFIEKQMESCFKGHCAYSDRPDETFELRYNYMYK